MVCIIPMIYFENKPDFKLKIEKIIFSIPIKLETQFKRNFKQENK